MARLGMAKIKFTVVASAMLLSGCATQLTWQRRAGLDHFVGRTQDELVASLGAPDRSWVAGGVAYAGYASRRAALVPGIPGGLQPGTDAPNGPFVAQDGCTTIFRMIGQRVQAWSLQGNSCFVAEAPPVSQFAGNYAGQWGAGHTTGFVTNRRVQEDPTPGRSVV